MTSNIIVIILLKYINTTNDTILISKTSYFTKSSYQQYKILTLVTSDSYH